MRLHFGSIPESTAVQPGETWVAAKEPPAWLVRWVLSGPVSILLAFLALAAVIRYTELSSDGISFAGFFIVYVALIPVHELIHVAAHPDRGLSRQTVVGFWPAKLVFFAHYEGTRSKSNLMLGLIAPFLFLTLVPLAASIAFGWRSWAIGTAVVLNAAVSSIDVLGFFFVLMGVPTGAVVHNRGWYTYWKRAGGKEVAG